MKASAFLRAIRRLRVGSVNDLTGGEPFVVLSPHPDDESLGAGGLIAAACSGGQRVDLVLITDGAGSHPNSRSYPPSRLAALRHSELKCAGAALGLTPDRLTCLGLPDTEAPSHGSSFAAAVDRIDETIRAAGAKAVFVTWKHDPHCDHQASAQMALALRARNPALKLWSFPIWGWHLDPWIIVDEPPPFGLRLDVTAWLPAKKRAILAHHSQMSGLIADDPQGFRFTPQTLAPFLGPFEYFLEVPR